MSKKIAFSEPSDRTRDSSSCGAFFSQLRRIAGDVDRGVKFIQQEVDSRKTKQINANQHATAINFLLQSKKEMTDLRSQAQAENIDFTLRSSSIARIQELMKNVLAVQAERLENVECFMEKYGYTRPSPQKLEVSDNIPAANLEKDNLGDAHTSEGQLMTDMRESDGSVMVAENSEEDKNALTPRRCQEQKKSIEQNRMRTPRLEDLYCNLSEETVMLFKHGPNSFHFRPEKTTSQDTSTSEFSANNWTRSTSFKENTTEIRTPDIPNLKTTGLSLTKRTETPLNAKDMGANHISTPEAPTLHTPGFKLNSFAEADKVKFNNNETPILACSGQGIETAEPMSVEPPKLLTPGLKLNCFASVQQEKKEVKSARSLFNFDIPPVPELRTCVLSEPGFTNCGMTEMVVGNEENEPKAKTMLISTPEPPKLLSRGLTLSGYSDVN